MFFKLPRVSWALFFACFAMCSLGLSDNIRGPLFPELIAFFGLNNSVSSLSFAFASTAAFFGTAGSAFLLRKLHLDKLLELAMALMGLGSMVMAVSSHYAVFVVGTMIFGFAMGTTGVAQNLLITENLSGHTQTKALSGLHSIYGFSSLLAPLLASRAPKFFAENFPALTILSDWRCAFYITGAFSFLVFLSLAATKAQPAFAYTKPEKSDDNPTSNRLAAFMISAFFASYVGAEILVSSRLALYMRTYHGMNLEQSSNYVTYFFIFLLAGRLFYALRAPRLSLKLQMNASLVLSVIFLALGLVVHPLFLTAIGIAMAPFYPMAVAYVSAITGVHQRAYLTFVMGVQSIYVIVMHVGVGYLTDSFGLFYAFGVGLILLLLSLICLNAHPKISD